MRMALQCEVFDVSKGQGQSLNSTLLLRITVRRRSRARFRELIQQREISLTPRPISRVGEREADLQPLAPTDKKAQGSL